MKFEQKVLEQKMREMRELAFVFCYTVKMINQPAKQLTLSLYTLN